MGLGQGGAWRRGRPRRGERARGSHIPAGRGGGGPPGQGSWDDRGGGAPTGGAGSSAQLPCQVLEDAGRRWCGAHAWSAQRGDTLRSAWLRRGGDKGVEEERGHHLTPFPSFILDIDCFTVDRLGRDSG